MKKINQNTLFANKILYYTSYSLLFIVSLTGNAMESNSKNKLAMFKQPATKPEYELPPISTIHAQLPPDAKLKLKIPLSNKTFESLKNELKKLDSSNTTATTKSRNFGSNLQPGFRKFLEENPEYIDQIVGPDGTLLHYVARYGTYELCRWLLKNNANPFIQNTAGKKPITIASNYSHDAVTKIIADSMYIYHKE